MPSYNGKRLKEIPLQGYIRLKQMKDVPDQDFEDGDITDLPHLHGERIQYFHRGDDGDGRIYFLALIDQTKPLPENESDWESNQITHGEHIYIYLDIECVLDNLTEADKLNILKDSDF